MTEERPKDSNRDGSVDLDRDKSIDPDNNVAANLKKTALTDNDHVEPDDSVLSYGDKQGDDRNGDMETHVDGDGDLRDKNLENIDDNAVDIPVDNKSKDKLPKEEVETDPNFAIICSFLEKFAQHLEVKYSIKSLKNMFEDFNKVRQDLIDLHLKLLKKRRKYINKEKWEKALTKFCSEYSNIDAWELERFGYKNAKLSLRLRIVVRLLESMFDYNQKFKSEINTACEASSLRVPPFGRDITGYTYWYQIDPDLNFRLYKDEPDEDGSWLLVSRNLDELNGCIEDLQHQTIETFKSTSTPNSEESNSNQNLLIALKKDEKVDEDIKEEGVDEEISNKSENEDDLDDSKLVPSPPVLCEQEKTEIKVEDAADESHSDSTTANLCKMEEDGKCVTPIFSTGDDLPAEISFLVEEMIETVQSKSCLDEEIDTMCKTLLSQVETDLNETVKPPKKPVPKRYKKKGWGRTKRRKPVRKTCQNENSQKGSEVKQENEVKVVPEGQAIQVADEETPSQTQNKVKSGGRKRRSEIEKLKEDFADSLTAKRYSRRIMALQEKKAQEMEQEQKRLEKELQDKRRKKEAAMAAKAAAALAASFACDKSEDSSDHQSKKPRRRKKKVESDDDYQKDSDDDEDQNDKKKKKQKRAKGKRRKGANPWEDSEDSEEEKTLYEDDYDDYIDDEHEELKFDDNNNEDEFACEEVDPSAEPVVIRRARTVKKSKDDFNDNDVEPCVNDDKPCGKCGKYDQPQWILLCDKCDEGYHTSCLRPPLFLIPTGDWFCPPCEHKQLIEKLQIEYKRLSDEFERQALEKQKLRKRWKFAHCEISAENILETHGKTENDAKDFEDIPQQDVKLKPDNRKRANRRRPNNGFKDELEEALGQYSSENSDDGNDDEDISDEDGDSRSDNESGTGSSENSDESLDEIGKRAFSDNEQPRYKKRSKKERHIDINDYSRSGLKLRSARKRKPINYLFKEYDDMIKSAIFEEDPMAEEEPVEEEEEETDGAPRSKGKDMENILKANAELPDPFGGKTSPLPTYDTEKCSDVDEEHDPKGENECDGDEGDEPPIGHKKNQKKLPKKKKLTNLDFSDDEEEDHASDEDFHMADDEDEIDEELTEVEEDDDNAEDDDVTESDSDLRISARRRSSRIQTHYSSSRHGSRKSKHKKHKSHSKSKKKKFIIDSDDDDDDDEEEEDVSSDELIGGSYSDESSDYAPRSRRAVSKKRVSYREASSTEDETNEKYHDDDDYDYEDEDDDQEKEEEESLTKETSDNPKLKVNESQSKKRTREDESDENADNQDSLDNSKKVKLNDDEKAKTEEKPEKSKTLIQLVDETKNKGEPIVPTVKPTEPILNPCKVAEKSTDQINPTEPYLPPAPEAFPKTADPLDSIKQMNSKFDEYSTTVPKPAVVPPPPSQAAPPPPPPAPAYPPPPPGSGVHYPQPPPFHSVSNSSYPNMSAYNPSQAPLPPNHPNYPLPPQQPPHQYLPRPSGAYPPPPPHTIAGPFHPSQPTRPPTGMPPPHNAYNTTPPGIYPPQSPARYTTPPPNAPPPTSRPNEKPEESYTLTNLDSFGARKSAPNYHPAPGYGPERPNPPLNDGQPQILNLDVGSNSYRNYPSTSTKTGPPPPPPPPHYYGYERPPAGPVPPDYYSSHQSGFYTGPPSDGRPMHPPPLQRIAPPHPTAGPYPPNQPAPHYVARNASPGHPPPVYSVGNSLPPPVTTSSPSAVVRQVLMPPTTSGYYAYPPYAPGPPPQYAAGVASNGGFMIQNLLHTRPPGPVSATGVGNKEPVRAVKSAPKATKSAPKPKKAANVPVIGSAGQTPQPGPPNLPKPKAKKPKTQPTPPVGNSEAAKI